MNIVFGLLLIAHGLVHGLYLIPNKPKKDPKFPFFFEKSWFAKRSGKPGVLIGKSLTIFIITLFVLSGIILIGFSSFNYLWLAFALTAALASEILFILFWHKWLFIGFMINLIIIFATFQII